MSVKLLCKIAIFKPDQETEENSIKILHNNKIYHTIINCDFDYIHSDISRHRDFCLVALKCDNAEYLTIFHDGTRMPGKNLDSRARILSIVFPDFQPSTVLLDDDQEANTNGQATKIDYVTTKLYDQLRVAHLDNAQEDVCVKEIESKCLQPQLRNYQKKTIKWLLQRELVPSTMKHFFKKFTSREGCECFVNLLSLDITNTPPKDIDIPTGGILADEMGLGKTVEMLALILSNQRTMPESEDSLNEPKTKKRRIEKDQNLKLLCVCTSTNLEDIQQCFHCHMYQHRKCVRSYIDFPLIDELDYICPQCWEIDGTIVPSHATVIVSPNPIKLQWLSEINKHSNPPLKVVLYEGVVKQKLSPRELASYDIVLTDYNVLRNEIHFLASNSTMITFRNARRRMRVNSPLLLVNWWRVCLDEAQMEASKSKASRIVKQLPAIHRWAITGTPIQRSLEDLITLFDFIGLTEVSRKAAWQALTTQFNRGRSQNMIAVLQKVMWRTCKSYVLNELGIPPQSEVIHFVELNNLEKLFYSDEHADCLCAFYDKVEGFSDLKGVANKALNTILQPMLKLRQDCSLPVIRLKSEQNQNAKKFLQPQELMDHMKSSNELECKGQLRSMASIYNGTAALYFLQNKYDESIKYYDKVLRLAKEYTGAVSVDSLLQIHALHNAIQAHRKINRKNNIISTYEAECNSLEWKYLEPYAMNLQTAHKAYSLALSALTEAAQKMPHKRHSPAVWAEVLMAFEEKKMDQQLIAKLNDEVFLLHSSSAYERFRSVKSVLMILDIWYKKINEVRKGLSNIFHEFEDFIQNVRPRSDISGTRWQQIKAFISSVYDCHLSHIRMQETQNKKTKKKELCKLCISEKTLQKYECLIFDKALDEKTSNAEGTWNPTMQETAIKAIYSFLRGKKELSEYVKDCQLEIEAIGLMKTEYKELVKLWIEIEYTVKAYDEMDMCKMRMSLAKTDEEKDNFNVYDYEIDDVLAESKLNFDQAQKEFVLKYARLKYIRHLEKDSDPGPCPICHAEEQQKYVVLECGHHLCFICLKTLSEQKRSKLCCAVCRHEQKFQNIHYVTRRRIDKDGFEMKGDYSSKIHEIVLQVMRLKAADENVKIIIFSQWQPILKAISDALNENFIKFRLKWSPQSIEEFKNQSLGITCMLMLMSHGSQGLNLIEATHVFLVEPILNPGEELQAIGRVHRIGQTKPTTVHRFIVKNTIEENIYNAVTKNKTDKFTDLTIESIKKLFEMHSND